MASFTTLVNIDAQAAHKVCVFVSEQLIAAERETFIEQCNVLIGDQKTALLINKLLEKQDVILALEKENGK
jgi:hypothetical protein